ncbi:tripartite tricarboxylate transporter substrate binding protein [Microbacteriaceae bacterium K1510]|nr:tripartite tricarboxylate transporter substrate binding protein [Microbacteriaceae bacterium K1510]
MSTSKLVAVVACSLSLALPALAQTSDTTKYPSRAIRILVPFSPGGGIDILARTTGQRLAEKWGVPVVVENRIGASGNIGTQAAASSPADGYTLLMTANTISMAPSLFPDVRFDPNKDFAPITELALGSLALVATPSFPAKSFRDLVTLAKASPGKINYSSPGVGTPHHLAMELVKQKAGINLQHVPYKGSAGALTDLVSGQVSIGFMPIHQVLPQAQAGQLRLLAAGGLRRTLVTPDTPSLAEASGLQDVDVDMWYGAYAPAGTPNDIIQKINRDMIEVLAMPDVRSVLEKQGLTALSSSPAELGELTRRDLDRWQAVIKSANIRAE